MIEKRVLTDAAEINPQLAEMELQREKLIDVVRYADAQRALCTGNDLKGFELITTHAKAARGLREAFCGERWDKDEENNQPGIRHPELKIRVIPCNFDENAGKLNREPTNRHGKGTASRAKAACNGTGWLPGLMMPEPISDDYVTWLLGIYAEDEYLGAELSLPLSFANGQFKTLVTRIVLLGPDDGSPARGISEPAHDGPVEVVDISVKRK